MIRLTIEQCQHAVAGLAQLGKLPAPITFGRRVAALRFAVQVHTDALEESRKERLRLMAGVDDAGDVKVVRTASGELAIDLTPAQQYAAETEYATALKESVELDVVPLAVSDFPAKVDGKDFALPADVFVLLGPLVVD